MSADLGDRSQYIGMIYVTPSEAVLLCDRREADDEELGTLRVLFPLDTTDSAREFAEEGKLGYGFTPSDELEEVDIGSGDRPRPTWVSKRLDPEFKAKLVELLREFPDCFAWEYHEMPGLDRSIVEHRLPIKPGFRPFAQHPEKSTQRSWNQSKRKLRG